MNSATNHVFLLPRVAGGNIYVFFVMFDLICGVSRLTSQKCADFGFFVNNMAIYLCWTADNLVGGFGTIWMTLGAA